MRTLLFKIALSLTIGLLLVLMTTLWLYISSQLPVLG